MSEDDSEDDSDDSNFLGKYRGILSRLVYFGNSLNKTDLDLDASSLKLMNILKVLIKTDDFLKLVINFEDRNEVLLKNDSLLKIFWEKIKSISSEDNFIDPNIG